MSNSWGFNFCDEKIMKMYYTFMNNLFPEPQTGFRIAFNMFDTDGNERVDKNEFLVVSRGNPMFEFL